MRSCRHLLLIRLAAMSANSRDAIKRQTRSAIRDEATKRTRFERNATESPRVFAVLACGSFNPITNMHLRMFEVAKNNLEALFPNCLVTKGIISPVSDGYGKKGLESSKHRIKMCSLAISGNSWLEVSSWEGNRKKWTPTLEVLEHTQEVLAKERGHQSELVLLCGSDFLESFNTPGLWKDRDIEKIVSGFSLIVLHRPGSDPHSVVKENKILHAHRENIHIAKDAVVNDTSSTSVRSLVRNKKSIKYLTPDHVIRYIMKNELYANELSENKNSDLTLAPFQVNKNS